MPDTPFASSRFLGYVNEVSPLGIKIHFPSAGLLSCFRHEGIVFPGGNVGEFVVVEGARYGFLAKVVSLQLPDAERKVLSEKAVHEDDTTFHPIASAELLLSFPISEPSKSERTISRYPEIGAKVYSCPREFIKDFVMEFGVREKGKEPLSHIGSLTSNGVRCALSLNSILNRHCAVIGTTGSGKSWTTARIIETILTATNNKIILTGWLIDGPCRL